MLYHLLYPLAEQFGAFNVVRYITFRTAAATLTALFITFLVGPWLIRRLADLRVGHPIREIGPDHQAKAGTPTMGGMLIIVTTTISLLLWSRLSNRLLLAALGMLLLLGLVGFLDDFIKLLQTSGHVHPLAMDVVTLDDHVTHVDTDPELDPRSFGNVRVAPAHHTLDVERVAHRIYGASELDQNAVAGGADHATIMFLDLRRPEFPPVRLHCGKRAGLVGFHEP